MKYAFDNSESVLPAVRGRDRRRAAAPFCMLLALIVALVTLSGCAGGKNDGGASKVQLSDLIKENATFTVELEQVMVCPAQGEFCVAQGAASDGKYVYFIMRKTKNGDCIICKYNLKNGKKVKTSEPLYLYHGNDMTYNDRDGLLYVCHAQEEGTVFTTVDPDTLKVVTQEITVEKSCGSLTYNSERNMYGAGRGTSKMHILDADLNFVFSRDREENTGYTAQGAGSDNDFIYFPMSSSLGSNFIEIYDWEGNYRGHVFIDSPMESETLFWVNGTYYINFNSGRSAVLCRLKFNIKG